MTVSDQSTMEDQELFDVISSTLREKGFIQQWKSELMLRAVQPLYKASELPCVRLENENYNILKLQLLLDLFEKLGLENTKQMITSEVDTKDLDSKVHIKEFMQKTTLAENEPFISALWRTSGPGYMDSVTADDPEVPAEDVGSSTKEIDCDESQHDLFETAISRLETELGETLINEDGEEGERSLRTSLDR